MKRIALFTVIALLICTMGACDRPESRRLQHAEAVMESAPESALAILDSIDTASLTHASDRALYALLLTQGRIKTYEVLTDDSLVSTAVRYYEDHGPDSNLMKSLFYQGEILSNNREFSKAIIPSMRAREMAISADNPYWHAKASELITNILVSTYQSASAIEYITEAIENYENSNLQKNHRYCLLDLGIIYGNTGDYERGKAIIDSICKIARHESDSDMVVYGLSGLYQNLYLYGDKDGSNRCYEELKRFNNFYPISLQDLSWYTQSNISDSSFREYEKTMVDYSNFTTAKEKSNYLNTKIIYFKTKGVPDSAIKYYDSLFLVLNHEVDSALMQSVVSIQKEYSDKRVLEETEKSENLKNTIIIGAIFFILIFVVVFIFVRQQSRLKRFELENRLKDIINLSNELKLKEKKLTKLTASNSKIRQISEDLYKMKWETLNNLCNEYFDKADTENSRRIMLSNIEKNIKKLSDNRSLLEIERALNKYMDGIMIKLRSQCSSLKEEDFRLLALIFAGFNSKSICLIFSIKINSFYSKRRRLIDKIEAGNAPDKKMFIKKIK